MQNLLYELKKKKNLQIWQETTTFKLANPQETAPTFRRYYRKRIHANPKLKVQPTESPFENKIYLSIFNKEFYCLLRFISSKYLINFKYPFSAEMNKPQHFFFSCSDNKGESYWVSTITPVLLSVLLQLPQIETPKSTCFIFCSVHSFWKCIEIESHHLIVEQRF